MNLDLPISLVGVLTGILGRMVSTISLTRHQKRLFFACFVVLGLTSSSVVIWKNTADRRTREAAEPKTLRTLGKNSQDQPAWVVALSRQIVAMKDLVPPLRASKELPQDQTASPEFRQHRTRTNTELREAAFKIAKRLRAFYVEAISEWTKLSSDCRRRIDAATDVGQKDRLYREQDGLLTDLAGRLASRFEEMQPEAFDVRMEILARKPMYQKDQFKLSQISYFDWNATGPEVICWLADYMDTLAQRLPER
jgi:hypothetical protein